MAHPARPFGLAVRAAGLGAVAGLRSQLPLALLAFAANRGTFASAAGPPLSRLRSRRGQAICGLSAAGELVADKLPRTPSRLAPGPLAGRVAFGALAGAAVAREANRATGLGAVLGGAGAALGAFAGYQLRSAAGRATGIPDPAWGAVEDAVALTLGLALIRQ